VKTLALAIKRPIGYLVIAAMLLLSSCSNPNDAKPAHFKIASSIYVGWMPWMYAAEKGYLAKAASARGMDIRLIRADYAQSIEQFVRGDVDAITITNIDALSALAASGVAADVVLVGSFSNGNDAILVNAQAPSNLTGAKMALVENSVSQYLLSRYLESEKIDPKTVQIFPTSDAQIAKKLASAGEGLTGVVTWEPIVGLMSAKLNTRRLSDSAKFPKEIADLLVIRRSVMQAHPEFAQALLHTWFQVMQDLQGPAKAQTIEAIAKLSGDTAATYQSQLDTTILLSEPTAALAALTDSTLLSNMVRVEKFIRERQLIAKVPADTLLVSAEEGNAIMRFHAAPLQAFVSGRR
jgi:NitT/TauT family transport system substrate-binding protein